MTIHQIIFSFDEWNLIFLNHCLRRILNPVVIIDIKFRLETDEYIFSVVLVTLKLLTDKYGL